MGFDQETKENKTVWGTAYFTSLISIVLVFCTSQPLIERLEVWWAELLVYALVCAPVTFVLLYRSNWHPEITGAARTLSLIAISFLLLTGSILSLALFAVAGFMFKLGLHADMGPG